ncbi:SusD/RagB family nutrient-binding outer membrane lipoprotein [Rufibacter latericius]|uniref:SusD/RagB family nutrient-binding outer membrane lipoprotein n=1 Tax=Rufibacter latericius TaxID=2487040 RepID=A0A3M9MA43_9BACT|nr:SusD/RagB family nutrient-binding outer membrane lipoprotein [Rufibacter latericius]RNI22432.1 SusD/RagB family nutrient-binding outer membrane lipoprotein [Rufibacter latericius]
MLKTSKKYISVGLMALLPLAGCDSFLDVNDDPNRATRVSSEALLSPLIVSTADAHFQLGQYTSLFAQQLGAYTAGPQIADRHIDVRANLAWNLLYLNNLTNANLLVQQATAQGSPYYVGVGKIMQALNLGLLTDTWGEVPFSQAFQGSADFTPAYDQQEQIYATIHQLLDDALVELQKTTSAERPGADDFIYAGDIPKWRKAANALKARYTIHLVERQGTAAANAALGYVAQAFSSNADDMQLIYSERNINPWNRNIAIGITTGNFIVAPSATLINLQNGNTYPGLVDPRMPLMADRRTSTNPYSGIRNGSGTGGNTDITAATFYGKSTSPLLMVTYSEMKFIEAEARFLANGGTRTSVGSTEEAYQAYLAGIRAHMEKLGVQPADITSYLSHPQVAVGAANLTLSLIMKEKLIALYLNPEAWVDVRRYDYDPQIYPGMALPEGHNPALSGQFIRRVLYPETEAARNADEVAKVTKGLAEKMWWDL